MEGNNIVSIDPKAFFGLEGKLYDKQAFYLKIHSRRIYQILNITWISLNKKQGWKPRKANTSQDKHPTC